MASDFLYSYCSIAVLSDHMQASKRNLCYNNASRQRKNHTTDFFIKKDVIPLASKFPFVIQICTNALWNEAYTICIVLL